MKVMFRDVLQETLKSELGTVKLNIPRDRKGEFEPRIVPKYQRNVTGIEDKIMALYAAGMTIFNTLDVDNAMALLMKLIIFSIAFHMDIEK